MITLRYDCPLNIAEGASVTSKKWINAKRTWSYLVDKLRTPVYTKETFKEFMQMTKDDQLRVKDVGGFVGGFLVDGKRNKNSVLYRQLIALDADNSNENLWFDFINLYDCAALIHSTHKSCAKSPRHRLLIPLDREVSGDEYQAIARKIASDLGMGLFDRTTFEPNRFMFWSSCSKDSAFYFDMQDAPLLSADSVLARYKDWQDTSEWAVTYDEKDDVLGQAAVKQENPLDKKGAVGVFCRAYSIQEAIAEFLSDTYEAAAIDGRYTYIKGSTSGGLIVYEDLFAYSHHGTDPAGGKLCNSFDLVRIHKFGHLDTGKSDGTPKSFKAMEDLVFEDPKCKRQIAEERFSEAKVDFASTYLEDFASDAEQVDEKWVEQLEVNGKGEYESSASNLNLIILNDPHLRNVFAYNEFDNKRYVKRSLPWRKVEGREVLRDVDYSGVRNYIECVYGITSTQKIDDALALEFERNKFHPIREYLDRLEWDGAERVSTLLIDYFGAVDNPYTRAAVRKVLCAAVARVYAPGTKFDSVLILVGEQGTYKSTFIKKLGMDWFSDTFTTVQGKEAFEQLQGAWIMEMAELSGLKKAEIETIKHYVSKSEDSFRPAYGRTVETYKRQCVFIGTTNSVDFLRDPTGNRRFMPVDLNPALAAKSVVDDFDQYEVDMVWAEAKQLYLDGETLYLDGEESAIARSEQKQHTEIDDRSGLISSYLDMLFPDNWETMGVDDRRAWLTNPLAKKGTVRKNAVCVAELWCECLLKDKSDMAPRSTRELNDIMRTMQDWEYMASPKTFPLYGRQRYYTRKSVTV